MRNPIVLIHGYSDTSGSFDKWIKALRGMGYGPGEILLCDYKSLTNEVSLKDIAEGFDIALRQQTGLAEDQDFDAIVHSTGMLVIRAWLASYARRRARLKHLVALAPATFGSPLAHKGRSWLGSIFKGEHTLGPDFLEAGNQILGALELGSAFTWDLAHRDLFEPNLHFGPHADTPYVFIFCGTDDYTGLRALVNAPGTDGTVRHAGVSLDCRKIVLDLTVPPGDTRAHDERFNVQDWCSLDMPLFPMEGLNHATIVEDPSRDLITLVAGALQVNSSPQFLDWFEGAERATAASFNKLKPFQQFVVRVVDERGDAVPDYNIQFFPSDKPNAAPLTAFWADPHVYEADKSYRNFHVDLSVLKPEKLPQLWMRVHANSGSELVVYQGFGSELNQTDGGKWGAAVDLTQALVRGADGRPSFFHPYTTTLIEIRLNRDPVAVCRVKRP